MAVWLYGRLVEGAFRAIYFADFARMGVARTRMGLGAFENNTGNIEKV